VWGFGYSLESEEDKRLRRSIESLPQLGDSPRNLHQTTDLIQVWCRRGIRSEVLQTTKTTRGESWRWRILTAKQLGHDYQTLQGTKVLHIRADFISGVPVFLVFTFRPIPFAICHFPRNIPYRYRITWTSLGDFADWQAGSGANEIPWSSPPLLVYTLFSSCWTFPCTFLPYHFWNVTFGCIPVSIFVSWASSVQETFIAYIRGILPGLRLLFRSSVSFLNYVLGRRIFPLTDERLFVQLAFFYGLIRRGGYLIIFFGWLEGKRIIPRHSLSFSFCLLFVPYFFVVYHQGVYLRSFVIITVIIVLLLLLTLLARLDLRGMSEWKIAD